MADLKAVARRFYDEVLSKGNYAVIDEVIHDDFVEHEEMPGILPGKDAPRAMTEMFRGAFPDLRAIVEDIIQEGDKVAVRGRLTGTHRGEFMGVPPTERTIDVPMFDILEFSGDKAIAHWGLTDGATMMEQLGIGAPPRSTAHPS